ncbi:MAG: 3-keto-5-aminohexanoate cleavage protein [Acetobacteraceae bacterium]|nr:3-keto-5-aminohexanoate cleavage protein [Acetobacteraceae bacterium]
MAGKAIISCATTGATHTRSMSDALLYIGRAKLASSNAGQVARIPRILEELSLEIAAPQEARQLLKLKGGDRVGF